MWCIRLFTLILFFISPVSLAKNQVIYFEPKISTLSGTIAILTLPGAPNYSSVKNGDKEEVGAYLVLDKPVDVRLANKVQMSNDEPENNILIIQLVLQNNVDWKKMENGNHVCITGRLFHATWAHHHTKVLLDAKEIKITSKEKIDKNKLAVYLKYAQSQF